MINILAGVVIAAVLVAGLLGLEHAQAIPSDAHPHASTVLRVPAARG